MNRSKIALALVAALLTGPLAMARIGGGHAPVESSLNNSLAITLIIIASILLLAIILLSHVVTGAASYYYEKERNKPGAGSTVTTVIILMLFASPVFAQTGNPYGGLSTTAFYLIVGVIGIELLVIFILLYQLRVFLSKEKLKHATASRPRVSLWARMNKLRPVEQEAQIILDHDYDGIRELDNRLPPWWLYGFYVTIIFAGVYLWRYHVSHTAPLSGEELAIAMKQADEQKAAYLKKTANNVDENTVKLLTDAAEISNGQKVFVQNCAACHGKAGEGVVGPNLTDDYWLHGGNVKDVFKTIKYGWPEKGMRSWKDDLSPVQIAQVTSYIKTLHGTNPPNGKEKQGELYQEQTSGDNNKTDSTNKLAVATNN